MNYIVYLLMSQHDSRTYIGCTNNLQRRLRQHNGEIVGGAKSTRGRKWKCICFISGFISKHEALSFEWHARHSHKYGFKSRQEWFHSHINDKLQFNIYHPLTHSFSSSSQIISINDDVDCFISFKNTL